MNFCLYRWKGRGIQGEERGRRWELNIGFKRTWGSRDGAAQGVWCHLPIYPQNWGYQLLQNHYNMGEAQRWVPWTQHLHEIQQELDRWHGPPRQQSLIVITIDHHHHPHHNHAPSSLYISIYLLNRFQNNNQ